MFVREFWRAFYLLLMRMPKTKGPKVTKIGMSLLWKRTLLSLALLENGRGIIRTLSGGLCRTRTLLIRDTIKMKSLEFQLHHPHRCSYSTTTNSSESSSASGPEAEQEQKQGERHRDAEKEPLSEWPEGVNPHTGEKGGPKGPEPTRYGDWERKGRVSDF